MLAFVAQMVKESACPAGDPGSVPQLGRSPGEGSGYPLQCSYPENSTNRRAWRATVHGVAKSQTRLFVKHLTLYSYSLLSLLI